MTNDDLLTFNGVTQPITEWALDYGIYPNVIVNRLARGWTIERAITKPMAAAPAQRLSPAHFPHLPSLARSRKPAKGERRSAQLVEHNGRLLTLKQWSAIVGISPATLRHRLKSGLPTAQALHAPLRGKAPGVGDNLPAPKGTGGGSLAQDIS